MISLRRIARLAVLVAVSWTVAASWAFADRSTSAVPDKGSLTDYTLAYFLVGLGIVLGMLFVIKTSNRAERDRPAQYKAKNILEKDG